MSYKTIRFLTVGAVGLALLLFTVNISKAAFSAAPAQADLATTETVTATASETMAASPTATETSGPTETETAAPTMMETATETAAPTMAGTPGPTQTETPVPTGTQMVTATPVATQQCGREEDRESASAEQHEKEDNIHPCVKPTQVSDGDKDDHDDDSSDCNVHNQLTEWKSRHDKSDPIATPNATPGQVQQKHASFQPEQNLPSSGGQNQSANSHEKNKQGNGNSQGNQGNNNAQGDQGRGHSNGGRGHKGN
jgi:hypothetical protein